MLREGRPRRWPDGAASTSARTPSVDALAHPVVDDRAAQPGHRLELGARGAGAGAHQVDDLRQDEDVTSGRRRLHARSSRSAMH